MPIGQSGWSRADDGFVHGKLYGSCGSSLFIYLLNCLYPGGTTGVAALTLVEQTVAAADIAAGFFSSGVEETISSGQTGTADYGTNVAIAWLPAQNSDTCTLTSTGATLPTAPPNPFIYPAIANATFSLVCTLNGSVVSTANVTVNVSGPAAPRPSFRFR